MKAKVNRKHAFVISTVWKDEITAKEAAIAIRAALAEATAVFNQPRTLRGIPVTTPLNSCSVQSVKEA